MEAIPQVHSVTVGSGLRYQGHPRTTTYNKHVYQCSDVWEVLAVPGPCRCRETETSELRHDNFVRWGYSV